MKIDHIVYAVPNFAAALIDLETRLGVRPQFGGYHQLKGTKNALLHLGDQCYLEILAVDEDNLEIEAPRWMGVDLIESPKITRWSLKSLDSSEESALLKAYHPEMGQIVTGKRATATGDVLTWEMLLPLASPEVELLPFFTDWQDSSTHPTDNLEEQCQLLNIQFMHPEPAPIQVVFNRLGLSYSIQTAKVAQIQIEVASPNGRIII
ncbi:MAG: VOC family protein [Bacteroidota bacterium]